MRHYLHVTIMVIVQHQMNKVPSHTGIDVSLRTLGNQYLLEKKMCISSLAGKNLLIALFAS